MEIEIQAGAGAATLILRGRLDAAWSNSVADALQKTVREGCHDLRLELAGVSYISSAGIRVLFSQWKEMRRAQGRMTIVSISAEVERVLKLAGLGVLLEASVSAATDSPTALEPKTQSWSGVGFAGEIEELSPTARWRGRLVGDAGASFNLSAIAAAQLTAVRLPASTLALGFGALGNSDAECASRLGELLAVGGCAVHLPPTGQSQSDYAVTEGALAPEARLAHGLVAEGAFARLGRFEVAGEATSVALSDLAAGMLAAADAPQIAFAAVVETAALVGACLRHPPGAPGAENIFAFPAVRDWLTFTAEPAYQNTTALLVGVAAQPGATPLAGFTRPAGPEGAPRLHVHAAVFQFRPIRRGKLVLAETTAALFDAGRVLGVLHLLPDRRPELGADESRFYRGACWFGPIDI
jgi:anti-anti-sigma factor